jgi:uncharacterized membrane protein YfcA
VYGLVTGFVVVGKMINAPLLLSLGLRKGRFVGTFSFIRLCTLPIKMVIYWQQGILNAGQTHIILALSIAALMGVWIGKKPIALVPTAVFEKLAQVTLFMMSVLLLFSN